MLKILIIAVCSVLVAGSIAVVDRRSVEFSAPTSRMSSAAAAPGKIFASGIVEGRTEDVELRPETSGRVDAVLVAAGDWVDAGQTLLRLDDRTERARVAVSLANLSLAEANLERLVNGARDTEREEARALLAAKSARLRQAQLTWQRVQTLRAQDAIAQQEADDQEGVVLALTAEVEAAVARLRQLDAPAREDELRAAQARVAAAQADHELTTIALDKLSLRSPIRAQVLEVHVEPGETVSPDVVEPLVVLSDTSQLRVRAFVEEIDAPRVVTGTKAEVTADGLPDQSFIAVVESVSPRMKAKTHATDRPNEMYDSKVREVLLGVNTSGGGLIIGLRVDVLFDVQQSDALATAPAPPTESGGIAK